MLRNWFNRSVMMYVALAVVPLFPAWPQVAPRIVFQSQPAQGPEIAAWTPDDWFVLTARAETLEVLDQDVASGDLIHRLLPSPARSGDYVHPNTMRVLADGTRVLTEASAIPEEGRCRAVGYAVDAAGRVIVYIAADDCGAAFALIPSLNRVLPSVAIPSVVQADDPGRIVATVQVQLHDGVDPAATNGNKRTGVYGVRLFHNDWLVVVYPDASKASPGGIDAWRATSLVDMLCGPARALRFTVPLPTAKSTETSVFSACAFDEDRVKSETARATFTRDAVTPPVPHEFIVAIRIEALLKALGGGDPAGARIMLSVTDFEDVAGPDDIVLFIVSGRGWTDGRGNFYLLPADTMMSATDGLPRPGSLLSSAPVVDRVHAIGAAEIVSVASSGFKPGPMADPGPGQLAGEKGLCILAASEIEEGLMATGGDADLDRDGRITADAWRRHAANRHTRAWCRYPQRSAHRRWTQGRDAG